MRGGGVVKDPIFQFVCIMVYSHITAEANENVNSFSFQLGNIFPNYWFPSLFVGVIFLTFGPCEYQNR